MTTNIEAILREDEAAILAEAVGPVALLEHYRRDGTVAAYRRVEALFDEVAEAVRTLDLDDLLSHAERVALERFRAGYELAEVQAAFGTLEAAMRRRLAARLPAEERAFGLGLVTTALVHGRDALGHAYGTLAAEKAAPDLTPLFRRSEPAVRGHQPDELVYPA